MNFLDRSGHIFNLPSYPYEPIGHEFEENEHLGRKPFEVPQNTEEGRNTRQGYSQFYDNKRRRAY